MYAIRSYYAYALEDCRQVEELLGSLAKRLAAASGAVAGGV